MIRHMLEKMPKLGSIPAQLLLRQAYDVTYGIFDHTSPMADTSNPLALSEMFYAEDVCSDSLLYERVDQYKKERIGDHFKISLKEFMSYPTDMVIHLLEVATHYNALEDKVARRMKQDEENRAKQGR